MSVPIDTARFEGAILGQMVGDSLGLPLEGIGRRRVARLYPPPVRHRFVLGRGMISDDTEHACFTARALIQEFAAGAVDPERFARRLAWKIRFWFLGLPAGIGFATLRSIFKLWCGFPPSRSGVYSAGNGPAMRSPMIGLSFCDDPDRMADFVRASTRLSHTDPKAERGAMAVAVAAAHAARHPSSSPTALAGANSFDCDGLFTKLQSLFPVEDREALRWLAIVRRAVDERWDGEQFCREAGFPNGPSGYMYHTVPAVLWAWLIDPLDFRGGMERILSLGGDADTTGAILGAVCGVAVGETGIPREWIDGVLEYPQTATWVRCLARAFSDASAGRPAAPPPMLFPPFVFLRNLIFLAIVLLHGLRRVLPPY